MHYRIIIELAIQMWRDVVGAQAAGLTQEFKNVCVSPVESFGYCIHLGAVARRENYNFTNVTMVRQNSQRF
jgi:hypothetical protein